MYSRSYRDDRAIQVPESYGGTALKEDPLAVDRPDEELSTESVHKVAPEAEPAGLLSRLPLLSSLGGLFSEGSSIRQMIHPPKSIGLEELLLIGVGLYLLFSSDGDRECAIILLAVLFIS